MSGRNSAKKNAIEEHGKKMSPIAQNTLNSARNAMLSGGGGSAESKAMTGKGPDPFTKDFKAKSASDNEPRPGKGGFQSYSLPARDVGSEIQKKAANDNKPEEKKEEKKKPSDGGDYVAQQDIDSFNDPKKLVAQSSGIQSLGVKPTESKPSGAQTDLQKTSQKPGAQNNNQQSSLRGPYGTSIQEAKNDAGLDANAAQMVSRDMADYFRNQGNLINEPTEERKQELVQLADNYNEELLNELTREEILNQMELNEAERQMLLALAIAQAEEAEQQGEEVKQRKAEFPFIMFILTLFEWFLCIIFSFVALFFTVTGILIPLAMLIEGGIYVWKASFSTFIYFWSVKYEARQTGMISPSGRQAKRVADLAKKAKVVKRKGFRFAFMLFGFVPLLDILVPFDVFMVVSSWTSANKTLRQMNSPQ